MSDKVQGYCMKCREKKDMVNPAPVFTKKGQPATKGKCPTCGTTLFRMGATKAHEGMSKPK